MTPQLWTRFLSFPEWRSTHPNLNDLEAQQLYIAELRMFQNYENELRNLAKVRQTKLVNQINTLYTDVSNILNVNNLVDVYGNTNIKTTLPSGLIIEGDEIVYIVTEDETTTYMQTENQS